MVEDNVSSEEWFAMLREGALFLDQGFSAGSNHGQQTHRIQWNVVLREAAENPGRFYEAGRQEPIHWPDVYSEMGNTKSMTNWEIGGEFDKSIWGSLFDTFADNFTRPEWVSENLKTLVPGMAWQ